MRPITKNVFEVGAIDWDRKLFDELIPLPDGTSYNAYIVKGSEKIALIDTVDPPKIETLIKNIAESGVKKIDYLISHHAEQDHSGSIPNVLEIYPDAKVVTNEKCKNMLIDLMGNSFLRRGCIGRKHSRHTLWKIKYYSRATFSALILPRAICLLPTRQKFMRVQSGITQK